jgi:hypothetical protein
MRKQYGWTFIGSLALVLVVYVDMALWTTFGPGSIFQQFPIIYLAVIPLMLIAVSLVWGRWPRTD